MSLLLSLQPLIQQVHGTGMHLHLLISPITLRSVFGGDGYYMAINHFANASTWAGGGAVVMDRTAMIAGNPTATMVFLNLGVNYGSLLPADADGGTLPPSGAPGYFVEMDVNVLRVWI